MAIAAASVGAIAISVVTALRLGPAEGRIWLSVIGFAAIVLCFPSLFVSPRDLLAIVVASLPPLMAFASEGEPSGFIAPVAVLLLVGAELNALYWESEGPTPLRIDSMGRLARIGQLALVGLAASLAVTIAARTGWLDATAAVVVAASGLVGLGWVILPRAGDDPVRPARHVVPLPPSAAASYVGAPPTTDPPEATA